MTPVPPTATPVPPTPTATPLPDRQPTFGAQTVSHHTFIVGAAIPSTTLPEATDGDGALTYTITPSLPAGITFDAAIRQLSGRPSQTQAPTTYAYTASDADSDTAIILFEIAVVNNIAPAFGVLDINDRRYVVDEPISALTLPEAAIGNVPITYTLEPTRTYGQPPELPEGLRFDPATRYLAGTPTRTQGAIEYTYTATDADGETASLKFEISIVTSASLRFGTRQVTAPSQLTAVQTYLVPYFGVESIGNQVYMTNVQIEPLTLPIAGSGNGALVYSLEPAESNDQDSLPAGLQFDGRTRQLTGTPTEPQGALLYTYRATDVDGDAVTIDFEITVKSSITIEEIPDQVYVVGDNISPLVLPDAEGTTGSLKYALIGPPDPANPEQNLDLPSNLFYEDYDQFRIILGKPTLRTPTRLFTYSVTDERDANDPMDDLTASETFNITVEDDSSPIFDETIPNQIYDINSDDSVALSLPAAKAGTGNAPLAYTLEGPFDRDNPDASTLPAGLTFDAETRQLTGTPTTVQEPTSYFYTVTDVDSDEDVLVFTITVIDSSSFGFNETVDDQIFVSGRPINPELILPEANGGSGEVTYTLLGPIIDPETNARLPLPSGVEFDAVGRRVHGRPSGTVVQAETEYTYTATDTLGGQVVATASLTFTIRVIDQFKFDVPDPRDPVEISAIPDQEFLSNVSIGILELPRAIGAVGTITYKLARTTVGSPDVLDELDFDATSRQLTGTPTKAYAKTGYTYSATDDVNSTDPDDHVTITETFNITVIDNDQPIFDVGSIPDQTYVVGVAINDLLLPEASRGSQPYTYTLARNDGTTRTLPDGLNFDANTRLLTGTPTAAQSAVAYTYTATDSAPSPRSVSVDFNITLETDEVPEFNDVNGVKLERLADQSYLKDEAITALQLPTATGGNGTLTYRFEGRLPIGLTFDLDTKTISGTPNELQGPVEYTWTVTDDDDTPTELSDDDTASVKFNITVGERYDYDVDDDGLIEVSTLAQLNAIRYDLNGDGTTSNDDAIKFRTPFSGDTPIKARMGCKDTAATDAEKVCNGYELIADLNFDTNGSGTPDAGDTYWNDGKGWDPIGGSYTATFEGNGRTISNLYISRDRSSETGNKYDGLFSELSGTGWVRNLKIENANVHVISANSAQRSGLGIVAGLLTGSDAAISNVSTSGTVEAGKRTNPSSETRYVGGLVGEITGSAVITRSYSDATVKSANAINRNIHAGGLVGFALESYQIDHSYFTGEVTANSGEAGGLVGRGGNSRGLIDRSFSTGTVTGGSAAGGIAGSMNTLSGDGIRGSYSTATISATTGAGGLVGEAKAATIQSSYASGTITNGSARGGLIGSVPFSTLDPDIDGSLALGWRNIIGDLDGGAAIDDTYWDTGTDVEDDARAKTTVELQYPRTTTGIYRNWDPEYWDFRGGCDYPVLKADFNGDGFATWQEFGNQSEAATRCPVIVVNPIPDVNLVTSSSVVIPLADEDAPVFYYGGDGNLAYSVDFENTLGVTVLDDNDDPTVYTIRSSTNPGSLNVTFTAYVVGAEDDNANTTFTVSVAQDVAPVFLSDIQDQRYIQNVEIAPLILPEAVGGNGNLIYSLEDTRNLATGLKYEVETDDDNNVVARKITGTPTEVKATTEFTWKVTDSDYDSHERQFNITIEADTIPLLSDVQDQTFFVGTEVNLQLPAATFANDGKANAPLTYTLTPDLAPGLTFNAATRTISGTPSVDKSQTKYTYTVVDANKQDAFREFRITVRTNSTPSLPSGPITRSFLAWVDVPGHGIADYGDKTYDSNNVLPLAEGGDAPLTYSLTGASLPFGLSFDAATRSISGFSYADAGTTQFNYRVTDKDGDAAEMIVNIEIVRDLDMNNDGLIEVFTSGQLFAMKWDTDGNGVAENPEKQGFYEASYLSALRGGHHACIFPANSEITECDGFELWNDLIYSTWQFPIGDYDAPFNAKFNGNGRPIIGYLAYGYSARPAGLFGVIGVDGEVYNVNMRGGRAYSWSDNWKDNSIGNAGMIAGVNRGIIRDSFVSGNFSNSEDKVVGSTSAGMVAGTNMGLIQRVGVINGYVLGGEAAGLLVGRNNPEMASDSSKKAQITDTLTRGGVAITKWKHQKVGAHVGRNYGNIDTSYTTAQSRYLGSTRYGPLNGDKGKTGDTDDSYFYSSHSRHERYGGTRVTIEQLESGTAGNGIFRKWDEKFWDFGNSSQCPILKWDWLATSNWPRNCN